MSDDDLPTRVDNGKPRKLFTKIKNLSRWRRISIGMYQTPRSAVVYGEQHLDASEVLALIPPLRERSGQRISPATIIVKIMGDLLAHHPEFNVMIRRRKFFMRRSADVFLQVAIKEGRGDLGGITIRNVDQKGVVDIAREITERAEKVRKHLDKDFEKGKKSLEHTPPMLMPGVVRFIDVLTNDLGLNLSFMGVKPDAWGGAMVSNIGSFGLSHGFAPLVPASRVPLIVLVGVTRDEAVVRDGEVVARPMLTMTGTFDHRVFDGLQLAKANHFVKSRFEQPDWLREELEALAP